MKYSSIFVLITIIVCTSILSGLFHKQESSGKEKDKDYLIPSVGSIEVLNGCGKPGIAAKTAELLRNEGFDVKSVGNAEKWNYPETIVASRTPDKKTAEKVAGALDQAKIVVLTNDEEYIEATVFIGKDYREYLSNGR